jgi:hypothetical protein
VGGLTAFFGCFGFIHFVLGLIFVNTASSMTHSGTGEPMPGWVGWIFVAGGALWVAGGWTLGAFTILSGRRIEARVRRTSSMVIAGINCVLFPLGTILGVITLFMLTKPQVIALYEEAASPGGRFAR